MACYATINFVQDGSVQSSSPAASASITLASGVTSGNIAIASAFAQKSSTTVTSLGITDNANNPWYSGVVLIDSTCINGVGVLGYAKNVSGSPITITATPNTSALISIVAGEWSGCDTVAPFYQGTSATGTLNTASNLIIQPGAITPGSPGSLAVGSIFNTYAASQGTQQNNIGYTTREPAQSIPSEIGALLFSDESVTSSQNPSGNVTHNNSVKVDIFFAVFNPYNSCPNNNVPLFIWGSLAATSGVPLYTSGLGVVNNNMPLFLETYLNNSGNIPLYTWGDLTANSGIPLYMSGPSSILNNIPLFLMNQFSSNNIPLYLQTSIDNSNIPLFVWGNTYANSGVPLYASGLGTTNNNIPLFVNGVLFTASNYIFPMYLYGRTIATSGIPLTIASWNTINNSVPLVMVATGNNRSLNLFLQTLDDTPGSGSPPLFIRALSSNPSLDNSTPAYISGGQNPNRTLNLMLAGNPIGNKHCDLSLSLLGGQNQLNIASVPLYLQNLNVAAGGGTVLQSGVPFFISAPGNLSGGQYLNTSLNLWIQTNFAGAAIPLILMGPGSGAISGIPLTLGGAYATTSGVSLVIPYVDSSGFLGFPVTIRGW